MKHLLLIAAALLTMTGMANAAALQMPKDMRGFWCSMEDLGPGHFLQVSKAPCTFDAKLMTVDARGFSLDDARCYLMALTKTGKNRVFYRMGFFCADKEGHFDVEQQWTGPHEGVLTITSGERRPAVILPKIWRGK